MDYRKRAKELSEKYGGKLEINSPLKLKNRDDLSVAYTPGVAAVSEHVRDNPESVYSHTIKGKTVAIVSDGSALLGLGDAGSEAALPVMEGKALLFKKFAGLDAFPLCLDADTPDEVIDTVRRLAPTFGGINLEDIAAPGCFEIENALQGLDVPVFHDDQHGTAIVVLAALVNALRRVGKDMESVRVVISGAGAAGIAIAKLLLCFKKEQDTCLGVKNLIVTDSQGILHENREDMNKYKEGIAKATNTEGERGGLKEAMKDADVFIGVSAPGIVSQEMIHSMAQDPVVFAMANPDPEISREDAEAAGAAVVATGSSDDPHQVNNVLAFPGIFKGALAARVDVITDDMKRAAAQAIAGLAEDPENSLLPSPFDERVVEVVAKAVERVSGSTGGSDH